MRKLFKFASVLSLLLCLATAVLWVRSYYVADALGGTAGSSALLSVSTDGAVIVISTSPSLPDPSRRRWIEYGRAPASSWSAVAMIHQYGQWSTDWNRFGVHAWIGQMLGYSGNGGLRGLMLVQCRMVVVPDGWLVGALLPLALAWYGMRLKDRRRRSRGLCTRCGYDLRASPEKCPECGTAVGKKPEARA